MNIKINNNKGTRIKRSRMFPRKVTKKLIPKIGMAIIIIKE